MTQKKKQRTQDPRKVLGPELFADSMEYIQREQANLPESERVNPLAVEFTLRDGTKRYILGISVEEIIDQARAVTKGRLEALATHRQVDPEEAKSLNPGLYFRAYAAIALYGHKVQFISPPTNAVQLSDKERFEKGFVSPETLVKIARDFKMVRFTRDGEMKRPNHYSDDKMIVTSADMEQLLRTGSKIQYLNERSGYNKTAYTRVLYKGYMFYCETEKEISLPVEDRRFQRAFEKFRQNSIDRHEEAQRAGGRKWN